MTTDSNTFDYISVNYDEDVEALLTVLYHKTRLKIGRDDPLLAMYYTNCFMAGRMEVAMRQVMDEFVRRNMDMNDKANADANDKAEKIVNSAIKAAERIVQAAITDSAAAIREESQKGLADIREKQDTIKQAVAEQVKRLNVATMAMSKKFVWALYVSGIAAIAGLSALLFVLVH